MNKQRLLIFFLILTMGVLTSGCISIEQEIFLQADGSGELVLHFSLPDLPEEAKKAPVGKENPENLMETMKKEVVAKLPPTIILKEAKEVKQNGTQGFYAVFQFKDIKDVEPVMKTIFKETTKDAPGSTKTPSEWELQIDKKGSVTSLTQRFFADLSDSKVETSGIQLEAKPVPEPQPEPKPATRRPARAGRKRGLTAKAAPAEPPAKAASKTDDPLAGVFSAGMDKQIEQMVLSIIKFRFVIHTPAPISSTNADIVLRGRTAMWDCSLGAFAKEKKPIEMKVSY